MALFEYSLKQGDAYLHLFTLIRLIGIRLTHLHTLIDDAILSSAEERKSIGTRVAVVICVFIHGHDRTKA